MSLGLTRLPSRRLRQCRLQLELFVENILEAMAYNGSKGGHIGKQYGMVYEFACQLEPVRFRNEGMF